METIVFVSTRRMEDTVDDFRLPIWDLTSGQDELLTWVSHIYQSSHLSIDASWSGRRFDNNSCLCPNLVDFFDKTFADLRSPNDKILIEPWPLGLVTKYWTMFINDSLTASVIVIVAKLNWCNEYRGNEKHFNTLPLTYDGEGTKNDMTQCQMYPKSATHKLYT